MTVVCSNCKKVLYEKCFACGAGASAAIESVEIAVGEYEFQEVLHCLDRACAKIFRRGYGGVSHGICTSCAEATLREMHLEMAVARN